MRRSGIHKVLLWVVCFVCIRSSYAASWPDLVITDLWLVGSRIHYQIQNIGTQISGYPHATTLLVDGKYRSKDVITKSLKPGERLNRSFLKETFTCVGIKRDVQAVADGDKDINELNELNNLREETWVCDQTPPEITEGPTVTELQQSICMITWKTNKTSDSEVLYGQTTGIFTTVSKTDQDQDHVIYLKGLSDATTYGYKVRSTDVSANMVESNLQYFTTSPPDDTIAPKASRPKMRRTDQPLFPLQFTIDAEDNSGLDRVVFSFDGTQFMTDFDPPYTCYVLPDDLGIMHDMYFGMKHVVSANVYDPSGNWATMTTAWAERHRCPEMELQIDLGTSTRVYAPEDHIDDYTGEIQILARKNAGMLLGVPDGPHPGPTGVRWEPVDDVRVYYDDSLISTITPGPEETNLSCPLNISEMDVPSTHEIKVEIRSGACVMVRRATMHVIQQVTELSVERTVSRSGTGFEVEITLTNDGTASAHLDTLTDEAVGFQLTCATSSLYDAAVTYNPTLRRSVIEYEFHCRVNGGASRTFRYTAIPILSESSDDYRLGENNSLEYHDSFGRDYSEPTLSAVSWVDGQHIDDAVDAACEESDYLIVTNPDALFGIFDPDLVNQLLAKIAELADVRNGVLAYYLGAGTTHTTYRSSDQIGCGNILHDWRDEIVLMDESDDVIRIYSPNWQHNISGELPISVPGLHSNDVLLVGNLLVDSDPSHPEDEIAIVDGHSSGSARGDVVLFNYRPDHGDFDQDTNRTTFDPSNGDQIIAGDMIYHATTDRDEIILFKGDTGHVQGLYGNGSGVIYEDWDSVYQSGDLVAAGDLISSVDGDEIVIGDISAQRIYIYSGEGDILHQYAETFESADTFQVSPEGLALADASAERLSIQGITEGLDWLSGGFDVKVHPDDAFVCGHVIEHGWPQYLLARGHSDDHFTHGDLEIFPYTVATFTEPGDRERLESLLNPGGAWADKMGDNFVDSGFLLIVGETEIIPAFACSYYLTGNGRQYIEFTDNYYGNTSGEMKYPEISVGRIVGNTIEHMMVPIQTSLNVASSDTELNFAEAYCFSGGPEERHETARHTVVEALEDKGWHVARNDEPTEDTIYSHTTNIDALYMAGHGNWDNCWNVNSNNVITRFDPGRTAPIVFASSCLTGRYPASTNTLGEHFLEKGASAYIGATEVSYSPYNRYLSEGFFNRLSFDSPIGEALKGSKRSRMGDGNYGKYQSAIYHFFGDPKLEAISPPAMAEGMTGQFKGGFPAPSEEEAVQGPVGSVQVSIPDFTVQHTRDGDVASIPGGSVLAEPGQPEVPAWPVHIHFPKGYIVQDVSLSSKEYTSGTNLSLIQVQPDSDKEIHPGPLLGDPDAWPDRQFDWSTEANPDGSTTLTVRIYPLRTWPASTNYTYFDTCTIHIGYASSPMVINRLWTNGNCPIGDPVTIELFFYNTSPKASHVIAEAQLTQTGDEENTIGLPIKYLRHVYGLCSCSWTLDTSGLQPDTYEIQVCLKAADGRLLAAESTPIQIGTTDGVTDRVLTIPACFAAGQDIKIHTGFRNTGQAPLNPRIILEIQTQDGTILEWFEDNTSDLVAGADFLTHWEWTTTVSRGQCRFKVYTLYDGKSTPVAFYPELSPATDADLDEDGQVNFDDFALIGQAWLRNDPVCDIAPDGGDCIVDMLELMLITDSWLRE